MNNKSEISVTAFASYLGTLLIFLGICRLHFYYSSFGISITHFLEFSEILTAFLNFIVLAVIFLIFSCLLWISFYYKKKEANIKRQRSNIYIVFPFSLLGLFVSFIVIKTSNFAEDQMFSVILIISGFLALIWSAHWIFNAYKNNRLTEFQRFKNLIIAVFGFFICIIVVFIGSRIQIHNVKHNNFYKGVNVYLKDGNVIKSNKDFHYIGKTNKYVFFFDSKMEMTEVYFQRTIEKIEFPISHNVFLFF